MVWLRIVCFCVFWDAKKQRRKVSFGKSSLHFQTTAKMITEDIKIKASTTERIRRGWRERICFFFCWCWLGVAVWFISSLSHFRNGTSKSKGLKLEVFVFQKNISILMLRRGQIQLLLFKNHYIKDITTNLTSMFHPRTYNTGIFAPPTFHECD